MLFDPDAYCYASSKVDRFIHYDFNDHTSDSQHARNIIDILKEKGIHVDGCLTFWEDCGPLAASICELLSLRGPGEQAARVAKKKSLTHQTLLKKTGNIPHFPRTYLYASHVVHIDSDDVIDDVIERIGLPAVMKLEYGSSAVGVKLVHDRDHCMDTYYKIRTSLQSEEDHPGVGLGHGNDLLLMEYISGTEHDIDIVMFNRQIVAAFISDNGPTRPGSYTETTASMPTCLPIDRQGQLITAAYQCCTEIGLVDGVFNVEMKMTHFGPKLIEINARMGGFYLRDWILTCYGVDILFAAFMISLGIRPIIPKSDPKCHIMGAMCVPSMHRSQFQDINKLNMLQNLIQKDDIRYNQIEASLEDCGNADTEEPFCNIAVIEKDMTSAKQRLLEVCTTLGISHREYDLNVLLKDFK